MSKTYLVFLDDGHGANTPGKRTPYIPELKRSIQENEFNSAVVKVLEEELKRAGVVVFLTAPTDKDTPLKERTDFANKTYQDYCNKYGKANVNAAFVSIHYNAFDGSFAGSNPEGSSIYVYLGYKNKEAGMLAEKIANYLKGGTQRQWRGVLEADFHVLRETAMNAVLSENGFMDNKREAMLMISPEFQKEVATEHAKGICDFFGINYIETAKQDPTPTESSKLYKVQIGAFKELANAKKLVEEAKAKGFQAFISE